MENKNTIQENVNKLALDTVKESREVAQIKGAVLMAKTHPRDETGAYNSIISACRDKEFAGRALYSYPRGGETVVGASIRLAEMMAQRWGNIDYGFKIVSQDEHRGVSELLAYCWDIENNTRVTRSFKVPHKIKTKKGWRNLVDPRDIYEYEANLGSRRLRACILQVIPNDLQDCAIRECKRTLKNASGSLTLSQRRRKCVEAFNDIKVTQRMIEDYLGIRIDDTTGKHLVDLHLVYKSIVEDESSIENFFAANETQGEAAARHATNSIADNLDILAE